MIALQDAFLDTDADRRQGAHCRFPARYQFLVEWGALPEAPRGACPELDAWRARIGEFELTLIFPEASLGNPASMFRHTLLRFDLIDGEENPTGEPLLG
ncbi:MAG: DUF4105 domain-containing protein [bacterium]|nr:DUF4105 domain-containing protein [bacterium]